MNSCGHGPASASPGRQGNLTMNEHAYAFQISAPGPLAVSTRKGHHYSWPQKGGRFFSKYQKVRASRWRDRQGTRETGSGISSADSFPCRGKRTHRIPENESGHTRTWTGTIECSGGRMVSPFEGTGKGVLEYLAEKRVSRNRAGPHSQN